MPRGGQSISFCNTHFAAGDRLYVYGLVKGLDIDRCPLPPAFASDEIRSGVELVRDLLVREPAVAPELPPSPAPASRISGRIFALSNTLQVGPDERHYRCQLYIPVGLPPSIRRAGQFSYEYLLAIRNDSLGEASRPVLRASSGSSVKNWPPARASTMSSLESDDYITPPTAPSFPPQISLAINIFPSPILVCPLTEWIPLFFKFDKIASVILPPPPLYPPLPPRPFTPTALALDWDFGAAFASATCLPIPIVGWSSDSQEPHAEFVRAKEKVDVSRPDAASFFLAQAGLLYLRWLSLTCLDMSSSATNAQLARHVTPEGVKPNALEYYLRDPDECLAALRRRFPAKTPSVSLMSKLASGFGVSRLVKSVRWMNTPRSSRVASKFVSAFEVESAPSAQSSALYRISVGGDRLTDIEIVGLTPAEAAHCSEAPPLKFYCGGSGGGSKAARGGAGAPVLEGVLGETLYIKSESSDSSLAVVEICARLKRVTRVYQPSLSPLEAVQWYRHRQSMGYNPPTGGGHGLSWLDFRSYQAISHVDPTLIVTASEVDVVAEASTPVIQTSASTVALHLPANLDASFRHERVSVSYELELEFNAIACQGVILDLASRNNHGKHSPFITINGPLLPRSTSRIVWATAVTLRPQRAIATELALLTH